MTRPFADAVAAYAQAGWPCILPVPINKHPPPVGYTGAEGIDTDPLTLVGWATTHADSSIALRMPDGVIGIDVDEYTKGEVVKHGFDTLSATIERWGGLVPSWSSTARGQASLSRIHFYRVPEGRYATKLAGGDVEIIQRHHRYAVVWPSPHPEAGTYTWYGPDGQPCEPPKPGELPELPEAWVAGLREGATDQAAASADVLSGQSLLYQLEQDERPACAEIASAALTAVGELTKADVGSRHDTATARVHHLIQLAAAGHPGVAPALKQLRGHWEELTAGEDRGEEWQRMLLTSARKAVTAVGAAQVASDPCLLIGSFQIMAPAPGALPGAEPQPIEPPSELHPFEVIGTALFNPIGHTDQTLAQAVLERTYPILRYGHDARTWLLRGRTHWETNADLSRWSVALLAELMPRGDAAAEKGTDARDQADRRKRFMSAGPARAIASKMADKLAGGGHPCAVRVADLDAEPWLLWAGGLGWDLRASTAGPVLAEIDQNRPHMHSAAVVPEVRPTPLWNAFTAAVWPDLGLRAWALRVLSIAVTGYADAAMPILIGETRRGKTSLIDLLMSVLGTYAHAADPRLLTSTDRAHASIVHALKGRRLSFIDEAPRDSGPGRERLKQLTGGAELTGNRMGENPITFRPTHTLILTANDEPVMTDAAMRARVRLIPCEGDPDQVRAARIAIGYVHEPAWRTEAPGVLAAMMREAAAWLGDRDSALTTAAPEAYRFRAEEIAAEQDPVRSWLDGETEPWPEGTRSRELYESFVAWCRNGSIHPGHIPTETKWGRELTRLGCPSTHARDGWRREIRVRPRGLWAVPEPRDGLGAAGDGSVTGPAANPSHQESPGIAGTEAPQKPPVTGVTGQVPVLHTHTHARAHALRGGMEQPVTPSTRHSGEPAPESFPAAPVTAESARITASLLAAREAALAKPAQQPVGPPPKPKRTKIDPAERAATKAAAKAAELAARIADAAGPLVQLPAIVTRDGAVRPISLDDVPDVLATFAPDALTVDVETSGYPIGHADYELRTIQLGGEHAAVYLDAAQPAHRALAALMLHDAPILHAHSATADLVPLAVADVVDIDDAWARMFDTVIPAKLADPASTGSDPGLKQLAPAVLGALATVPGADEARAALFKAGKWLTDTKTTTPRERSGWANVDPSCTTMVVYGASDVLDTAAVARRLPQIPPVVLERERTAQRMTARVAHRGLAIDGEHVSALLAKHTTARAEAAERVRAFGIDNPGSNPQVGDALLQLGVALPRTATGKPSVAEGVLEPLRAEGRAGELVAAVLDYRHNDTALGTFLEPYHQLVTRGDGRARPTVYTLGADTGRMSCVRPNLQQVPREGGFRACITADPGTLLISADFAGVELRVAAALSGDVGLRQMIAEGIDLHWEIARQVYGPEATKSDRYDVKRGVFGRLYGGGIPTLARQVGISESVAAAMVDTLDAMTPGLSAWSRSLREAVQAGHTQFPTYAGRVIHLPAAWPHKAPNYCIQGTARELLIDTLMRWQQTRWGNATLLPVHDEIVAVIPEAEAAEATAALVAAMECELFGVKIKAEASEPSFAWSDAA